MKRLVIVGAGQMARILLKREKYQIIAFAYNDAGCHGMMPDGVPVMSVEEALKLEPDCVLIAINRESSESINRQLFAVSALSLINCVMQLISAWLRCGKLHRS